jgi:tetratricopeptide (TPR) repeat protein
LQQAIPLFNKKVDRVLPQFILGQCYSQLERGSDAKVAFQTVLKLKPSYELEFQSKLQILLTDLKFRGNYEQAIKQLLVMLEDVKNESYKDVIYYALGTTALSAEKNKEAVEYFEQSLVFNKTNKKKRVKTFITLADLYFDQKQYMQAQVYYDSTYKNLDEKHERFKEVKARAQSLNELVGYLNTISNNDSLATLCNMSSAEIDKKLERIHEQKVQEMEEKKLRDEEARLAALKGEEVNGTFWIYNADARERGKRQFDDVWNGRPLKDFWGIQAQLNNMFSAPDESQLAAASSQAGDQADSLKYKVPSVDDMKKELPCSDTKRMAKMSSDLTDAYYQSGLVYKEKLDDIESAITSWENMLHKTPESGFTPMAYYQLFRAWLFKEQNGSMSGTCETCSSSYWGAAIKKKYPGSDWAMLVDNPDYVNAEQMRREDEEKQYKKAYGFYANNGFLDCMAVCDKSISERPNNHLICQYRLLRAICLGKIEVPYGTTVGFEEELNRIVTNCAGSEQAIVAASYLNQLKGKGGSTSSTPVNSAPSKTYTKIDDTEHYVVAVVDINGDLNKSKIALSNFNSTYFSTNNYKTSTAMFDVKTPMLLVKSFPNLKEATDYFTTFVGDQELATALGLQKTSPVFIITKQNYQELFRTKDFQGYLEFFNQNY